MIGNAESISKIKDWLINFNDQKVNRGGCFLTGATGLGKTTLVLNAAKELDYEVMRIVPSTMPSKKDIKTFVHNTLLSRDVVACFTKKPRRKILMVDDIENIGPTQKICLVEFLQWIYPSKKKHKKIQAVESGIPFVFVGRHTHIKAVQTALKHCLEIQLQAPSLKEQVDFVKKSLQKEQIKFKTSALERLVVHCQNDIRQLRMMITEITKSRHNTNTWTDKYMEIFLNGYVQIHKENGLLQGTREILNGEVDFKDSVILFDTDRYKIPLMIHENYIKMKLGQNELIGVQKINEIMCVFDQIDSYMYKQQYWNLQYLCGALICGGVSATVKHYVDQDKPCADPIFTRHMNRVSLATVKRKNILTLQQKIKIETSTELFYIKNLLFPMGEKPPVQKWIDFYGLSSSDCDVLFNLFSN